MMASPQATAAIIRGTFEGTIGQGVDLYGYFGTPSGVLTGEQFSGSLSYDTDLAPLPLVPGSFQSSGIEWLTAAITINGRTWSFDSLAGIPEASNDTSVTVTDDPNFDSFSLLLNRALFTSSPGMEMFVFTAFEESSDFIDGLALPESLNWSGLFSGFGAFQVDVCIDGGSCAPQSFGGDFLLSRLSLESTPVPVPEPAGWALLGVGFVAAWTQRRTRRRTAVSSTRP